MLSSEINGALTSSTGWRLKLLKKSWNHDDGHIAWGYAEWKKTFSKLLSINSSGKWVSTTKVIHFIQCSIKDVLLKLDILLFINTEPHRLQCISGDRLVWNI